ncbi:hypothetical protein FIBSPDRAFT_852982 [Athelia psychrophila]|uniref:Uncharacterized protein n=1 Tax=Athelia psychrophila TaxID=1759441 RepID=A0A166RDT1_9AGAM|nr:hypothetical protein FIBSPDRAFT_869346 [Fibularhizoctonia sp. CBS 109695]KZP28167.1 hypothetical protein FIBSPDRAFT_852982 [Fibularhizoctonia sp. CBS 109695]
MRKKWLARHRLQGWGHWGGRSPVRQSLTFFNPFYERADISKSYRVMEVFIFFPQC